MDFGDDRRSLAARAGGIAFLAVAVLGAAYGLYGYSKTILICYETNASLTDQNYVDLMIGDIVKHGDHGGRDYPSRIDYLDDRTECCTIERITLNPYQGKPAKREVSVSAKYFNTTLQDYVVIQRLFDACGHPTAKPLTAG